MSYPVKCFFIVQSLLMLKVLSTQDSEVEDLFCVASTGSGTSLSSSITSSAWGLSLFKMPQVVQYHYIVNMEFGNKRSLERVSSVRLNLLKKHHGGTASFP